MSDDVSALKSWAAEILGVPPENGPADDILRAVHRMCDAARDAASALPFEAEPAGFIRCLERLARERPDHDG